MSVVDSIQRVRGWLESDVCPLVKLKKMPSDWRDEDASKYDYELVHPVVLGMYWPTGQQLMGPQAVYEHPGILVQLVDGEDSIADMRESLTLRLHLSAWNPGLHGRDVWEPSGDHYVRREADTFQPSYEDSWADAWNFCDTVLREIRNASDINGLTVDRSKPVSFGPYSQQGDIVSLYPFWFAWVELTVTTGEPAPVNLQEYL